MIAIPAIDLRDGACVQLVGGAYENEKVRLDDPEAVAIRWARLGFRRLHVVDLDAATTRGSNASVVRAILAASDTPVQVGGGVRSSERAAELLGEGAHAVIVGTRAIEDFDWLVELSSTHPGQVIVAADVRDRQVVTHGWTKTRPLGVIQFLDDIGSLDLAGILVTAVHMEGQLKGTDLDLMREVVDVAAAPVLAAGGVTTRRDLDELEERGVAGAVIGMALYTGALDSRMLAEEYGE